MSLTLEHDDAQEALVRRKLHTKVHVEKSIGCSTRCDNVLYWIRQRRGWLDHAART